MTQKVKIVSLSFLHRNHLVIEQKFISISLLRSHKSSSRSKSGAIHDSACKSPPSAPLVKASTTITTTSSSSLHLLLVDSSPASLRHPESIHMSIGKQGGRESKRERNAKRSIIRKTGSSDLKCMSSTARVGEGEGEGEKRQAERQTEIETWRETCLRSRRTSTTCSGFRLLSDRRSSWIRPEVLPASPFPSVSVRSCICKLSQSCRNDAISTLVADVLFKSSCRSFMRDLHLAVSIGTEVRRGPQAPA
eukprot:758653-Hanusia_phi.AAC.3